MKWRKFRSETHRSSIIPLIHLCLAFHSTHVLTLHMCFADNERFRWPKCPLAGFYISATAQVSAFAKRDSQIQL